MSTTALLPIPDPRRSAPDQPLPVPGWWHSPLGSALVFVAATVAAGFVAAVLTAPTHLAWWWRQPLVELVACVLGYLAVLWHERRRPAVEVDPRRAGGLFWGLLLGAGMILAAFALCWACGWRRVLGPGQTAWFWQQVFSAGLVAGVSEEVLFRGMLFRLVEAWLGTWGATAVSAAFFGAAHLANPHATWWGAVAVAVEAGLSLALLYALTRSLWVVAGVHAAWNVVQGPVLGSVVSGTSDGGQGLVHSVPAGPDILSGGAFGLEASLVSVLLWCLVSVAVARLLLARRAVVAPLWHRRRDVL